VRRNRIEIVCLQRSLTGHTFRYVYFDAMYIKVREDHRVISKAVYIAQGVNDLNKREILGFKVSDQESKETWRSFLQDLRERGLAQPNLVISDAHQGLKAAIQEHPSASAGKPSGIRGAYRWREPLQQGLGDVGQRLYGRDAVSSGTGSLSHSSGTGSLSHFPADNQFPRTGQSRDPSQRTGGFDFPEY